MSQTLPIRVWGGGHELKEKKKKKNYLQELWREEPVVKYKKKEELQKEDRSGDFFPPRDSVSV